MPWILGFGLYALTAGLMRTFDAVLRGLSVVHAERLEFLVSTTFFSDVARKTSSFFVDYNPAEIQSAMSNGSGAVGASFYIVFTYLLPALLSVVFGVALIGAAINISLVLIVLVYGMIYVAIVLIAMEKTNRYLNEGIDAAQQNAAFTGNAVAMIEPIRHAGSTHWMDRRFSDKANDIFESFRAFAQRQIAFGSITALALFAQILIAYWIIYPQYHSGTMTVGGVVLFNMLLLQMNAPFEAIGQGISEFQRCFSRFLPYLEILREPNEHDLLQSNAAISQVVPDQISLKGVSFLYQNGRGVRDLSLVARKGAMTFITGETGTGKSTVFRLLQKTIEPQQGEIHIGNIRLSDISKADWFSCSGIVPQEIQMLNDSVRTNIVLGRDLDEERLMQACQRAAIYDRILAMEEGFETMLGERGLKLSGGERQRIAIARALYNDPVILLLDEASSALDEETERLIMDQLRSVADQLIIIAITHRLSSIRPGDQVVELGN